jgi:hypothetical protein
MVVARLGARPGGQWSRRIRLDHSFPSQINALHCVLNYNFKSIFTDNTDNISGFAWEFEVQPTFSDHLSVARLI